MYSPVYGSTIVGCGARAVAMEILDSSCSISPEQRSFGCARAVKIGMQQKKVDPEVRLIVGNGEILPAIVWVWRPK